MLDMAFVILNYNIFKETVDCVKSIRQMIDTQKYHIVIVDNGSNNGSFEKLQNEFNGANDVSCISSGGNLGFARGNNAGIHYVRKLYSARFICCLNNDTLLEQGDFYQNLVSCYEQSHAAVVGPKVILRNGVTQPLMGGLQSLEEYERQLRILTTGVSVLSTRKKIKQWLLKFSIVAGANRIRHHILGHDRLIAEALSKTNTPHKDIVLHGCCLVFTPEFFERCNGFNPRTFMFREEELLFLMIQRAGLHTVYEPSLQIRHLEDVSTDTVYKRSVEKEKFLKENQIKSLGVLIDELKQNNSGGTFVLK